MIIKSIEDEKIKKRKVSKKTKKSWRKHVDVKDVDKFLENERSNEREGVREFVIDVNDKTTVSSSKAQRRELLRNKEPKCFSALKSQSRVLDPISKRNTVKTPEERKNPITRRIESECKLQGKLKLKEQIAIKNRIVAKEKWKNKPKRDEFQSDIWKSDNKNLPAIDTTWMSSDATRHTFTHLGLKKKKLPSTLLKKPSVLPAVEVPHPGTSYNPTYEDHQNLLREIAENELKLMKEEAHLDRVTTKMFKKVPATERDNAFMKEMSEGLSLKQTSDKKNSREDPDSDSEFKSINPPVKNIKKTKKQRRKQKEQKELAQKLLVKKMEKKKISDIYRLKLLHKKLEKQEKKIQILKEKRLKKKAKQELEPKTLSKVKFEPLEHDFKLPQELTGALRNSAPAGNILKDRFKSLQQRNILAPGTLSLKIARAKVKRFEKPNCKVSPNEMQK